MQCPVVEAATLTLSPEFLLNPVGHTRHLNRDCHAAAGWPLAIPTLNLSPSLQGQDIIFVMTAKRLQDTWQLP